MKVKDEDFVRWVAEKKRVNVAIVAARYGLPEDKACRLLLLMWERGKIAPMRTAFFTIPIPGGGVVGFDGKTTDWYDYQRGRVMEMVNKTPDYGVGIREVYEKLGISHGGAARILEELEISGDLIKRKSKHGGIFGNRPWLYGLSEKAIAAREDDFRVLDESTKSKRKGASGYGRVRPKPIKVDPRIKKKKNERLVDGRPVVDMPEE